MDKYNDPLWLRACLTELDDQLEIIIGYFRVHLKHPDRLPITEDFIQSRIDRWNQAVKKFFKEEEEMFKRQEGLAGPEGECRFGWHRPDCTHER